MSKYFIMVFFFSVATLVIGCFDSHEKGDKEKLDSEIPGEMEESGASDRNGEKDAGIIIDSRVKEEKEINDSEVEVDEETAKDSEVVIVDSRVADAPCEPNCPGLQWVLVPEGIFDMGSSNTEDVYVNERPAHEVTVPRLAMLKTEVTVSQYSQCVDAGACSEPFFSSEYLSYNWKEQGRENHPVNGVSWNQAKDFAAWVGARLPSEAEWEYATRSAGKDSDYPWGNETPDCDYAVSTWGVSCIFNTTMKVCSMTKGNTAQGLCDMAGNVEEWVDDDYHDNYEGAPRDGSAWIDNRPRGENRVVRGSSWKEAHGFFRTTYRRSLQADDYRDTIGFRLARTLP